MGKQSGQSKTAEFIFAPFSKPPEIKK